VSRRGTGARPSDAAPYSAGAGHRQPHAHRLAQAAGLAKLAIRRARREKPIARGAPISLVGYAPSDVIAARANGIRAIAVETGTTPVEELRREGPHVLLKDLRELRLWMVETPLGT